MQSSRDYQAEIRKSFKANNAKKQRKTTEYERLEISSRILRDTKGTIKNGNSMGLTEAEDIKKRWQNIQKNYTKKKTKNKKQKTK